MPLAFFVAYLIGIAIFMVVVCVVWDKTDESPGSSRSPSSSSPSERRPRARQRTGASLRG
jgi:hypothetical protein